jgi:monofunctional glycosyltransferase
MYEVHLCTSDSNYVKLHAISPYMIHAVIVSEDGSFYSHEGFDWHEMQASFEQDLRSGRIERGGSTLTQQLAKNAFLNKDKSVLRKLKEAYLAHAIEKHYTKDFILEKYLNVVEFGDNIYGVKSAALHYFHKSASELNPLESAYLAMLLPNPKVYSRNFAKGILTPFVRKTVSVILKRMNAYGKLSQQGYELSMSELPKFPWSGVSSASFQGAPSYNLDAAPPAAGYNEPIMDEQALDEVVNEEESAAATHDAAAATAAAPPSDADNSSSDASDSPSDGSSAPADNSAPIDGPPQGSP